jgi:RimJ/RimL family protein N-acetyltransferase
MVKKGQVHQLKNKSKVTIRPMVEDDFNRTLQFFKELPQKDILYLKVDVTDPEVVRQRLKTNPMENVFRIVALNDDKIVADATLRWPKSGWMSHVGEIRVIIAKPFRRIGLASILYQTLFVQAVKMGLEKLEAEMTPQQLSARKSVEKLGFKQEGTLPKFVKDIDGNLQDLIIMSVNVGGF